MGIWLEHGSIEEVPFGALSSESVLEFVRIVTSWRLRTGPHREIGEVHGVFPLASTLIFTFTSGKKAAGPRNISAKTAPQHRCPSSTPSPTAPQSRGRTRPKHIDAPTIRRKYGCVNDFFLGDRRHRLRRIASSD